MLLSPSSAFLQLPPIDQTLGGVLFHTVDQLPYGRVEKVV